MDLDRLINDENELTALCERITGYSGYIKETALSDDETGKITWIGVRFQSFGPAILLTRISFPKNAAAYIVSMIEKDKDSGKVLRACCKEEMAAANKRLLAINNEG